MALSIGDNFKYQGRKPNFERDSFATLADMKAFPETSVDDGHVSYCAEDGKHYEFKSSNAVDETTGKWRAFAEKPDTSNFATKTDLASKVSGAGVTRIQAVAELPEAQEDGVLYIVTGEGGA